MSEITNSNGVNWSNGVNMSDGVNESYGVDRSNGVNSSDGVDRSNGVNSSDGVSGSSGVNSSDGVTGSTGVSWSCGVNGSSGVSWSYGVNKSYGVNSSYGILKSFGVNKAMFLVDHKPKPTIFGKEVEEHDYDDRLSELLNKLKGWHPNFNNAFKLYDQFGREWKSVDASKIQSTDESKAWEGMPQEAIDYIKSWPEFNAETFKEITGIDVGQCSCPGKVVEVDGKKYRLEEV